MSTVKPKRVSGIVKQWYFDILVGLVCAVVIVGLVLAGGVT